MTTAVGHDDAEAERDAIAKRLEASLPSEAHAYRLLAEAYVPAIALLSASVSARRRASSLRADLRAMEEANAGAGWLYKLAEVLDEEPYLALEPATELGILGRMSGIAENFQLNVLLMDVFPRRTDVGPRVSAAAAANARGRGGQQLDETITGSWNLHTWQAVQRSGHLITGSGTRGCRPISPYSRGGG
jgi:hypothetical protein